METLWIMVMVLAVDGVVDKTTLAEFDTDFLFDTKAECLKAARITADAAANDTKLMSMLALSRHNDLFIGCVPKDMNTA